MPCSDIGWVGRIPPMRAGNWMGCCMNDFARGSKTLKTESLKKPALRPRVAKCSRESELDLALLILPDKPELEIMQQDLSATGTVPLRPVFLVNGRAEAEA